METRNYDATLELRADGDGRTVVGIAVPYDVEQRIGSNLVEVFRKGVFRNVTRAANRVKLLYQHKTDAPIGRAVMLEEREEGLYGEFRISRPKPETKRSNSSGTASSQTSPSASNRSRTRNGAES